MARRVIVWSHSVDLRGEVKMGELPWSVDDMLPVDSDRDDVVMMRAYWMWVMTLSAVDD